MNEYKILVIDDDPDIQWFCRDLLEPQGYAVALASSGAEGREAMAADPADLVILDVMMEEATPGLNRPVVCRQLSQRTGDLAFQHCRRGGSTFRHQHSQIGRHRQQTDLS
jgi:two-component system OmpR family response regulator